MARQNHGPLSRAKGKLGGVVYQQYEGMQISREYQPVIKNPQTSKQVNNRAIMKLASQTLAQFKDVILMRLAKISIYTRERRGVAIRNLRLVITSPNDNEHQVTFDAIPMIINDASISGIAAPAITTVSNEHSVVATSGDTVVISQADYDANGLLLNLKTETYTSTGLAKVVTPATGFKTSVCMAVAFHATTEAGRAIISNAMAPSTGSTLMNRIVRGIAAGDIEITNMAENTIVSA